MGINMNSIIEPDTKFTPTISAPLEPQIDWAHGSVVLGRDRQTLTEIGLNGTMPLGVICEHQSTGASLFGYKILFDNKFPHIIFICGKRGSGKSYTLGVIVEELGRSNTGIGTVVIDPLGTFWTMSNKNDSLKAKKILPKYGLFPKDFKNIRVLAPIGFYEDMKASVDGAFSVAVSDLTVDDWCLVFDIDRFKTQGLLIGDVLDKINNGYDAKIGDVTKRIPPKKKDYTIGDIIFCIQQDISINSSQEGYALSTRRSVIARFRAASKWGIFSIKGTPIDQISKANKITILDVSHSKLGSSRRALIVGILARKILEVRIESSRKAEASRMGLNVVSDEIIPVTWLIIDEAHLLLPASGKTAATESLIEYAKLGRKPGCGLVFATQRPAATNDEILSQVDTIIGHNLALEDDIAALRRRIPAKMPTEFSTSDFIRGIPVGVCIVADQKTQKRTMLVQIRPRMTHHSGKADMPKITTESEIAIEQLAKERIEGKIQEKEPEKITTDKNLIKEIFSQNDILKPTIDVGPIAELSTMEKNAQIKGVMENEDIVDSAIKIEETKEQKAMRTTVDEELSTPEIKSKFESKLSKTIKSLVSEIDWGGAYLINSKGFEFALNIFSELSKETSNKGLCITRVHPDKLKSETLSADVTKLWLSNTSAENSISPGNITKLAHVINEQMKTSDKSIILLDGLEYLINNNDFPKILKFIEAMHEKIVLSNGILLLPINRSAMEVRDFELLENELVHTIKVPSLDIDLAVVSNAEDKLEKELDESKEKTQAEISIGKPGVIKETQKEISSPTKEDLKRMCSKLGLKTTGSAAELKKRLLEYDATTSVEPPEAPLETQKEKPSEKPEKAKQVVKPDKLTKEQEHRLKALEKERKLLMDERKQLKSELKRLLEVELARKMEAEKQKLAKERQKLELEKDRLKEKDRKISKKVDEIPMKPKPKMAKIKDSDFIRRARVSKERLPAYTLGQITKKQPMAEKRFTKRKTSIDSIERPTFDAEVESGKKMLVVKSRLNGDSIEEFAVKQLKTSLLGKPLESINAIKPVYLPIFRLYLKTMRGSIFAKEYEGVIYWDQVTGEIITDSGDVLKRSKGISTLLKLTPNQAIVLAAIDTWGDNDVIDIQNEVSIPVNEIKRALTALKKKSLVVQEYHTEKRMNNYKRKVELKFPRKFDKIKVDMPRIIKSNVSVKVLDSKFKLSEFKKWISNISPGTRIISSQEVYYPYFKLEIIGKEGPRVLFLDAISGDNDKLLSDIIQFQN